jgi:hypothetical protein
MRSRGNFHPDWGHFTPAPNFRRIVVVVSAATTIGAMGSAAVVLSLVNFQVGAPDTPPVSAVATAAMSETAETTMLSQVGPSVAQPAEKAQAPSVPPQEPQGSAGKVDNAGAASPAKAAHQAEPRVARNSEIRPRLAAHRSKQHFRRFARFFAQFRFNRSW